MVKLETFTDKTPSTEEVKKTYAALEAEIASTQKEIDDLKARLNDAETIYSVVNHEDSSRVTHYEDLLAQGKTKEAESLGEELNRTKKAAFTKGAEIAGLKRVLAVKNATLLGLIAKSHEEDFYLTQAALFKLFDAYNRQAADLARTVRAIVDSHKNCADAADKSGVKFFRYINEEDPQSIPTFLPKIVYTRDNNGAITLLTSQKNFWNYHLYMSRGYGITAEEVEEGFGVA